MCIPHEDSRKGTKGGERESVSKCYIARLDTWAYAPRELLGTAYGWFNLTAGVMLLPASLLFGWLWQTFSPEIAFGFAAGCAMLAAMLLKFWVSER